MAEAFKYRAFLSYSHADTAVAGSPPETVWRRHSGNGAKALDALRRGRNIIQAMTALSPDNADWQEDLARFDEQIATLRK
ncbi:MAG: hypothetical protein ACLPSF_03745 [Methylocella sp.]